MMIDNLRFTVLQDDIDKACKQDKRHCVIALAIKRKLHQMKIDCGHTVEVDLATIRFSDRANYTRYTFLQPPQGQVQLARFDRGEKIEPFELKLSRPMTGPTFNRRKAYKKPIEIDMTKPGRPSVHGVKRFPPRATPATLHSSKRKYGSNALAKFWAQEKLESGAAPTG